MTHEERVFEMIKAIAPVIVKEGHALMDKIVNAGGNPDECRVGGMTILEAKAQDAREWAEAFVNEFENANTQTT